MNVRVAEAGSGESFVPAHIIFYYTEDSLHNNVMIRTMYRAKNIRDNEGNAQIDDYAISEDEKDAFRLFLSGAVHEAFNQAMKMTSGVSNALILGEDADVVFPVTVPDGIAATDVLYGFKVKDHEAYNGNNIVLVDEGVKQLVETHIMRDWYEMVGNEAEYSKFRAKYNEIKRDLITKRLFQLRKPFIS